MSFIHYIGRSIWLLALIALVAVAGQGQVDRPATWSQDLNYLEGLSPADSVAQQDAIVRIRTEVESWLKLHPESKISLAPAPTRPWDQAQTTSQIHLLHDAVESIMQEDPSHPFHLGVTEVEVSAALSPLSPVAESIDQQEIRDHNVVKVTQAINLLPGVEIQHIAGNRNEAAFMIRGFSSNGQVPIYLDGIPIYVPYDGYIDLNRFLTSDLSEVQITKGFSSPLLGPNALGGAVNLVTREPIKKLEGDLLIGTGSGNGLLSSLHLGTRTSRFFAQGSLDWFQVDYVPLSGNFQYPAGGYAALTPGNPANTAGNVSYPLTDHENNSYSRDEKWSGRVGWTPHASDEYVFSYINQKGQKSVPLYMGTNSNAAFRNFWKWPYWNKDSYYFLSKTGLGENSSIKFRVYYDQFRNSIDMYDNSAYDSFNNYSKTKGFGSEHSMYNEHTDGASTEFSTRLLRHNVIGASFFFKDDTHDETAIYPGAANLVPYNPLAEFVPDKKLRDQQTSIGAQDLITFTARLHATVGFSADHLKGLKAETYNAYNQPTAGTYANTLLLPYQCISDPTNASYSGCTAHFWNVNPQASLTYAIGASDFVFVTFADRGRFPTLKQRYSSGMGSALPNPDLTTEHSRNWNIGYSHLFGSKVTAQMELFRSDLRNAIEGALVPDPGYPASPLCPFNNAPGFCNQNINIGKETHEGMELEVRSRIFSHLSLDTNYTYLNRTIGNAALPTRTSLSSPLVLPIGIPKNKLVGTATVRLPREIMGIVSARYEGGIQLQDTSYASTSPQFQPYGGVLATMDLGIVIPVRNRFNVQTGVGNLFDRNFYYTAGYPEEGRNWFLNLRYQF